MPELRYDPVLEEWVIISPQRQDRTFLPPDEYCPLCPTKPGFLETEIPESDYEIAVFENRFPSLKPGARKMSRPSVYRNRPGTGACEVVCYTPAHSTTLAAQSPREIEHLIEVWRDRYAELGARKGIKYVLIFENKGKEIGVTLTHPHGQIYAFPFIPPRPMRELRAARKYYRKQGACLFCDILKTEQREKSRIVAKNRDFVCFIPYWAHWPYEVHLYSFRHIPSLNQMTAREVKSLAAIFKDFLPRYDRLFGFSFPYIMILHQAPTDGKDYPHYHLHFEFYPPYRHKSKLKYLAGCESGGGTFINDTIPEEKAQELRDAG